MPKTPSGRPAVVDERTRGVRDTDRRGRDDDEVADERRSVGQCDVRDVFRRETPPTDEYDIYVPVPGGNKPIRGARVRMRTKYRPTLDL